MRREQQIVAVNPQVAHRGVRQIELQRLPMIAVVERRPNAASPCRRTTIPRRTGSSRTVLTGAPSGRPSVIFRQVVPPSCVR